MRIIEVCPECGADIIDVVLTSYPPRQKKVCSKCDWYWEEEPEEVVRIPFVPPEKRETITIPGWRSDVDEYMFGFVPECCRHCSNHPSNGGSGICNCTLPYMTDTRTARKLKTNVWTTNATTESGHAET